VPVPDAGNDVEDGADGGPLGLQYGVADAAIDAFRKVEKPEGTISPTDTYVLAQAHLKGPKASQ
jgi:hypothetical protein